QGIPVGDVRLVGVVAQPVFDLVAHPGRPGHVGSHAGVVPSGHRLNGLIRAPRARNSWMARHLKEISVRRRPMTPYYPDLRQRILETARRGDGTLRQIARRFLVSISFVTRLLQLHRTTGSLQPRPHGGGNPAVLTPEDREWLRELIRQRPDATLEE